MFRALCKGYAYDVVPNGASKSIGLQERANAGRITIGQLKNKAGQIFIHPPTLSPMLPEGKLNESTNRCSLTGRQNIGAGPDCIT